MRKWKNLRDTLVRELRKVKTTKSGDKGKPSTVTVMRFA